MPVNIHKIGEAETELENWLVVIAEAGVLEMVFVGLLRDYTDDLEHLGYVSRIGGQRDY